MMSRILAWLIVSMLSLTGFGMAESNDETELRTVVRAMMTAYLNQDVERFAQHVVPSVEGYDNDARFGVQGFSPEQLRHAFASGFKPDVQIRQVHARVFGHTASVTVEMDGSLTEMPDKTRPGPWRLNQLWSKKTGQWQLMRYHGFPLLPRRVNAQEALKQATVALERFRDVKVAKAEGYVHYDGHDTFMMGEHWYNRDVVQSGKCELSKPSHLQYLMIDGRRTLIGTGYICLPTSHDAPPAPLFGDGIIWHMHGPALCRLPNESVQDFRSLADALPNALSDMTWQQVCQRRGGGTPVYQDVNMLHA